jgi:hypothetical protein
MEMRVTAVAIKSTSIESRVRFECCSSIATLSAGQTQRNVMQITRGELSHRKSTVPHTVTAISVTAVVSKSISIRFSQSLRMCASIVGLLANRVSLEALPNG